MRVLVVEDDETLAGFVSRGLEEAGWAVDHARDGKDALELWTRESYDAAVVDVMLPRLDGIVLVEEARRRGSQTPVIFLSARRSVDDRIRGLHAGGDDYLTKPFSFDELLARLMALVRRSTRTAEPTRLAVADLSLDLLSREVVRAGRKLDLSPREFSLLEYLMRNPGRVIPKTAILSRVWSYSFDPQTNVVDVLVSRLRDKVDRDFETKLIHTVRGIGYVLRVP